MRTHYIKLTVVLELESDADSVSDLQHHLINIAKNVLPADDDGNYKSEFWEYEHIARGEFESAHDGGVNAALTAEGGL